MQITGALVVVALALVGSLTLRGTPASAEASPSPGSTEAAAGTATPTSPAETASSSAPAPSLTPLGAWASTAVAAHLNDLTITGRGYLVVGDDLRGGVVWTSINGRDWVVDDDSVIFDRVRLSAVASNSHLTAIIGCDRPATECTGPAAWTWDGTWLRVAGNPFGATTLVDVAATSDAIVILGVAADGTRQLWSSVDGAAWAAVPLPQERGDQIAVIAADGQRLLAVGRAADLSAMAWISTDLRTWTSNRIASKSTALTAAGFHGTFVVGGGLVSNESSPADPGTTVPATWLSADGATWTGANLVNDGYGAITVVGATSHGYVAGRTECCGAYFIPPAGLATAIDDGPSGLRSIVEGPEGFIGVGSGGFSTSPAVAINPPLEPVRNASSDSGEGWQTPTSLPVVAPLTAASDATGIAYVFSSGSVPGSLRVDRFDGTWLRLPDIAGGISGAKAVMGTNGLIYLVGVTADGRTGRTIEFDPTARTWRLRAAMPTARTSFGIAAPANGSIYVFGGRVSPCCDGVAGEGSLAVVERFDPAANKWQPVRSMPVADASPGAVAAAAPVPAGADGGPSRDGTNPIVYVFLPARAWAYDPAADTWTAGPASLSYGVTGSPVLGADGIVRVFNCDRYDMYDPFNNHWQVGGFLPSAQCGAVTVAGIDAQIFVFGGDSLPNPGRSVLAFFAGGG